MKAGFTTSEFWIACGVQLTALITALGSDDSTAKIMAGATALGAVLCYLYHRYSLKVQEQDRALPSPPVSSYPEKTAPGASDGLLPVLALVALLFFSGPALAQQTKPNCGCCQGGGCVCNPWTCDCGAPSGGAMHHLNHTHAHAGSGFRLNLWIGPRPVIVAPAPVVAPVQIVYVDPARPVFPGSPVFVLVGPPPVYYQFVPQAGR